MKLRRLTATEMKRIETLHRPGRLNRAFCAWDAEHMPCSTLRLLALYREMVAERDARERISEGQVS